MLGYTFNPFAEIELEVAVEEYENRQIGLGLRFLAVVEAAVRQLCEYPESGPVRHEPVRAKVLSGFPYTVLYSIKPGELRILAVAHQHQQPMYWLGRK
jgi:plasmid stabilization system protein ParE